MLKYAIYEKCEQNFASMMIIFSKILFAVLTFLYSATALWPILYIVFGYPAPSQWIIPIDAQSVKYYFFEINEVSLIDKFLFQFSC